MTESTSSVTIQADDPMAVRSLLRNISGRWGPDARQILGEFINNVLEHCGNPRVDLILGSDRLVALDYGGGIESRQTRKASGQGGYGLLIIETLGGELTRWQEGTCLTYRSHAAC